MVTVLAEYSDRENTFEFPGQRPSIIYSKGSTKIRHLSLISRTLIHSLVYHFRQVSQLFCKWSLKLHTRYFRNQYEISEKIPTAHKILTSYSILRQHCFPLLGCPCFLPPTPSTFLYLKLLLMFALLLNKSPTKIQHFRSQNQVFSQKKCSIP